MPATAGMEVNMEQTQIKAEFIIISEQLSLAEMINILGVKGDHSGDKNDVLKNGCIRGESFIEFCTEYEESLDIYEQYSKVLAKIKNIKGSILSALEIGKLCCRFCIVIKIEDGITPAMSLNNEFINLMHELKAEVEFDTYANPYESVR